MRLKTLCAAWLCLAGVLLVSLPVQACDSTSLNLISYSSIAGGYEIQLELCIGGGVLGGITGASGPTGTFALSVYGANATGFSPSSLTSDTTGVTYPGNMISGQSPPFSGTGTIFYLNSSSSDFTCVSNTAVCGRPHRDCNIITITTDALPDSIRALGLEGAGNPAAGCLGDPSVNVLFGILLNQEVLQLRGVATAGGAAFSWDEIGVDKHTLALQQFDENGEWNTILNLAPNSPRRQQRSVIVADVEQGEQLFKLVALSGNQSMVQSNIVSITMLSAVSFQPNPANQSIWLTNSALKPITIQVIDAMGRVTISDVELAGNSTNNLSIAHLPAGIYFIRQFNLQGSYTTYRLIKN